MKKEELEELADIYTALANTHEHLIKFIRKQEEDYSNLTPKKLNSQVGVEMGDQILTLQDAEYQLALAVEVLAEFDVC